MLHQRARRAARAAWHTLGGGRRKLGVWLKERYGAWHDIGAISPALARDGALKLADPRACAASRCGSFGAVAEVSCACAAARCAATPRALRAPASHTVSGSRVSMALPLTQGIFTRASHLVSS